MFTAELIMNFVSLEVAKREKLPLTCVKQFIIENMIK